MSLIRLEAVALSLLIGCVVQPPPSAGRSPLKGSIRVATWNVHDLFDAEDRLWPPGELDAVPTAEEVEARLGRIAEVLALVDADVVLLQEVETPGLASALAARAGYREARLLDGLDPRGIDVALLSRHPVETYVSHATDVAFDGAPLWSRDCVEARVSVHGRPLVVAGSHLVSRLTDPGGARRREQAGRLREIADRAGAASPAALVVAGGDLNDEPGAWALEPLLADGRWTDALAFFGAATIPTWSGDAGGARLDYLLVPAGEAWRVLGAAVVEGAEVAAASDHRPVAVDLHWGG